MIGNCLADCAANAAHIGCGIMHGHKPMDNAAWWRFAEDCTRWDKPGCCQRAVKGERRYSTRNVMSQIPRMNLVTSFQK